MTQGTNFSGPVISGTKKDPDGNGPANTGLMLITQVAVLTQNGTNAVTATFAIPGGSTIVDFNIDTTVVWNSGTSDTLTAGITAGGTDYIGGISVKTAGRVLTQAAFTAAQLAAMANVGTNRIVFVTVTPVGTAATTGTTTVTLLYIQNVTTLGTY